MLHDRMPVDVSDGDNQTALHYATMSNQTDVIKHLVHEGADVNRQDRLDKETPLHLAARYNYTEAARLLLGNGAEVMSKWQNVLSKTTHVPAFILEISRHRLNDLNLSIILLLLEQIL